MGLQRAPDAAAVLRHDHVPAVHELAAGAQQLARSARHPEPHLVPCVLLSLATFLCAGTGAGRRVEVEEGAEY